jgi:hypothetical protein
MCREIEFANSANSRERVPRTTPGSGLDELREYLRREIERRTEDRAAAGSSV